MLFHAALDLANEEEIQYLKIGDKAVEVRAYKYDFIGEIARELGTFHEIFDHLVVRFNSLSRLKKQLDSKIQSNCYSNTKKGNIKEATGIVNLKSNWGWTDRQAVQQEINVTDKTIEALTAFKDKVLNG